MDKKKKTSKKKTANPDKFKSSGMEKWKPSAVKKSTTKKAVSKKDPFSKTPMYFDRYDIKTKTSEFKSRSTAKPKGNSLYGSTGNSIYESTMEHNKANKGKPYPSKKKSTKLAKKLKR